MVGGIEDEEEEDIILRDRLTPVFVERDTVSNERVSTGRCSQYTSLCTVGVVAVKPMQV